MEIEPLDRGNERSGERLRNWRLIMHDKKGFGDRLKGLYLGKMKIEIENSIKNKVKKC